MKKVFFLNFWPKGGMKHYSDSLVNILNKKTNLWYISNYSSKFKYKKIRINLKLNPLIIKNYFEIFKLRSIIKKEKPSIIHINSGFPILLSIYPYLKNKNSVITIHDVKPHEGESLLKRIYHKIHLMLIFLFIDKVIVHSEKIKKELPDYFKKKRVYILPHVNYKLLNKRNLPKKEKKNWELLFFGRILAYKGLKYLLEAFKKISSWNYNLIIAGEGKINFEIPKKNNIKLINRFITDKEMIKLFSYSDVVILPYISASQSGIVQLAFAFDKPVIATDVGAISELVKNDFNGILIKPKSSNDIVKAIKSISKKEYYNKLVRNIKTKNENNNNEIFIKLNNIYKNEI